MGSLDSLSAECGSFHSKQTLCHTLEAPGGFALQKLVPLGVADGCRETYRATSPSRSLPFSAPTLHAAPYGYCIIQSGGVLSKMQLVFSHSFAPVSLSSLSLSYLILVLLLKGAFNDKYHMAVGTGAFISAQKLSCNNMH